MDRSMKVMFGMMTVAICLLAITMMNTQSQQAYAGEYVGGGDRGTEPTIVSFRVTPIHRQNTWQNLPSYPYIGFSSNPTSLILLTRMWSDGAVEMNIVGSETITGTNNMENEPFTGWVTVTDSVAGYACVGDVDGNRSVDPNDLMAVIWNWGECEQDPPLNLPPDPDLM